MEWIAENVSWLIPSIAGVLGAVIGSLITYFLNQKHENRIGKNKEIDKLKEENHILAAELEKLRSIETFKQSLTYVDTGFYFKESGDGTTNEYYCAKCLDSDSKKIRINIQEDGDYICPVCRNTGLFNEKMRDDYFDKYGNRTSSDYDWQVQNFLTHDGK